jgi:hypothetical protein
MWWINTMGVVLPGIAPHRTETGRPIFLAIKITPSRPLAFHVPHRRLKLRCEPSVLSGHVTQQMQN